MDNMVDLVELEFLVLGALLIVSFVGVAVRRFRVPSTVVLVLVGIALSFRTSQPIELTSDIILFFFLPPLLFEAAFHLDLRQLQRDTPTIALLAIVGVLLSTLVVGGIVSIGTGLPLGVALVFGSLIAATDPVSVVAIFRKLGAPKRLEVLLEGESLFNDGTAIVLFGLALEALLIGEFNFIDGILGFILVSGGGIVVGLGLGWVVSRMIAMVDDHLIETTLTTVLAFGAYLVAEQLHLSGVLAVVAAGLVTGSIGEKGMSPTTRIVVFNFWEYVTFLVNSAVFLMIGLQIEVSALWESRALGLWAIFAVLVARAIGIYGLTFFGRSIPSKWRHVLFWGGLRGAIALALALSLPTAMGEHRDTLTLMTFSVVLFTLLFQGVSMEALLRRLGLITHSEAQIEYEQRHARAIASRSGYEHVERLHRIGLLSDHTWERIRPVILERVKALTSAVQEALQGAPELEAGELITARRESLRAQRNTLSTLRSDGVIGQETYEQLVAEVDIALDTTSEQWSRHIFEEQGQDDICQLMMVVIQDRDLETVSNALSTRHIPVTRIQSMGGFLRQRNHLLLVGLPEGKLNQAMAALESAGRSKIKYVTSPKGMPGIIFSEPLPIEVKGATVFVFDIDRCEV
ncbi:MAG: Na+/H+ antiporter, partial [Anaerolineales bacterium]|nr:Na+/H+ antiporter [Anaerolineales bacterium]